MSRRSSATYSRPSTMAIHVGVVVVVGKQDRLIEPIVKSEQFGCAGS